MNRMNRHQHTPNGLLYSVSPKQLAQLHVSDDVAGDEFDWAESSGQYENESLTCDMLNFMKEFGED